MADNNIFCYPRAKDFIFTIFDDTDVTTLDYIRPIYDFLNSIGLKTTKSVWPCDYKGRSSYAGSHSLEHREYAEYMKQLYDRGFEIAYHGASMESSNRERVEESFDIFYKVFGCYPSTYASHAGNQENLYWGIDRFSIPFFRLLSCMSFKGKKNYYQGHIKSSPFFWGDISRRYIKYVRNFTYNDINLLNISNKLPYKDEKKEWINQFFFTSDAENVEDFNQLINEDNQDKLEKQKGICIISTHFGKGFLVDGKVHKRTKELLSIMSKRNGWFVPVVEVLDFLASRRQSTLITSRELFLLEFKWFLHAFIRKLKRHTYKKTEVPYLRSSTL